MDENRPAHDVGTENPSNVGGHDYEYDEAHDDSTAPRRESPKVRRDRGWDYEYDEAHDVSGAPMRGTAGPRRVMSPPPKVNLDEAGDYGYDRAHDFDAS